jgi:DNA repair protein RadD
MGYSILVPRDYQFAAVDSIFDYWTAGRPLDREQERGWGNPVVALPTGTGKSLVIAEFIRRAWQLYPGTRILVLTHVKELVGQNFEKLVEYWPTAPVGIYSAGLRRKDIGKPITFAGIGSVAKVVEWFCPDVILIDECHTVSPKETTTYRKVIASCQARNPFLKVAGLSATPYRLGQGEIIEPGGIFNDICFDLTGRESFNWFLSEGYLKRLIPKPTETEYDISGVHVSSTGDFNLNELQSAVDKDKLNRAAVAEMIAKGSNRKHWLVFAAGIQHAEHITSILVENGISAVCVHSKSTDAERDEAVRAFKAGEVRALVNNGVFTTGFDFPGIDLIAVLRHTTSPGLWVQMLGRGTRPVLPTRNGSNWHLWPHGAVASGRYDLSTREGRLLCISEGSFPNCLVLDFAKNTARLGPINDVRKPNPRKKKGDKPGDPPAKVCETCLTYNHASARVCCECGAEFHFRINLKATAAEDELIAGADTSNQEPLEEWFPVETVSYSKHVPWNGRKRGPSNRPTPSLRVTYNCPGLRAFTEYVCLEHGGHAQASARQWWTEASSGLTIPQSVDEALCELDKLREPERIRVWINRKNPQVMHREFQTS